MTHTPLLTLLLVIAGNFCYGQAAPPPRFFLESGVEQPLDQGAISSASAGKIIFPFNFQATVIDQTTGLYIKTELFTSYSLTEHGVDPGAYGIEWVYGGEFSGPKPQVISFDKNTGEGLAAAVLRINRVDNDGIWGHFEPGLNELTLYWGSSQEVYHNNFSPPTLPAGSSTYLVTAAQPEIEIAVADNRVLYSQQAGTIVVVALPKPYPRTFDLWTDNPAVADVPATFQIAAGEELAFITFSPLAKGSGHMFASEQGALAVVPPTFSSHKFGIFGRPRRWVREGNTAMNEGDGFGGIRCLAGGPSTPEGN
ncbi:MAG: hypothetical protein HOE66_07175 [Planctomycetes bacterium]|nr:hypothetical protein [Planctomycetota bacterium]